MCTRLHPFWLTFATRVRRGRLQVAGATIVVCLAYQHVCNFRSASLQPSNGSGSGGGSGKWQAAAAADDSEAAGPAAKRLRDLEARVRFPCPVAVLCSDT